MTSRRNLPGLLADRANTTPDAVALTFHDLGIWNPMSWSQLAQRVEVAADELERNGVHLGDTVVLISENRSEWIIADLAIQAIGAASLPLRPDFSPERVQTLCRQHGVTHFVVGDQQQFDKITPLLEESVATSGVAMSRVAMSRVAMVFDVRGIPSSELGKVVVWGKGQQGTTPTTPTTLASRAGQLDDNTVCTHTVVIGSSKGGAPTVEVIPETAASLLARAEMIRTSVGVHTGDQLYPFANLADPTERSLCEILGIALGSTVNLGEGGLLTTLESRAVQPTIAHVPAKVLNSMHADIVAKRAKRGLRKVAVDRLLRGAKAPSSQASLSDLVVTYSLGAGWIISSLVVHSALRSISGAIRLGIIAALAVIVLGVLIVGGFAVRPFLRKAYGLGRARSLLTGNGISAETAKLLDGLKLSPVHERIGTSDD